MMLHKLLSLFRRERPIDLDLRAFRRQLPDLLKTHAGQWALFAEGNLVSLHEEGLDALQAGYDHAGLDPFMVRQVEAERVHRV